MTKILHITVVFVFIVVIVILNDTVYFISSQYVFFLRLFLWEQVKLYFCMIFLTTGDFNL